MKKLIFLFPVLLLFVLAACNQGGSEQSEANGSDSTATENTAMADSTEAEEDVEFIDKMIPHHRSAIHMADMIIKDGSDSKLKEMARKSRDEQQKEIEQMQSIRQTLGAAEAKDETVDMDMPVAMDRMMQMKGKDLDKAFLQNMIPHHRQAVDMVKDSQEDMKNAELKQLAQKIADSNQKEVTEMQQMLDKMGGS